MATTTIINNKKKKPFPVFILINAYFGVVHCQRNENCYHGNYIKGIVVIIVFLKRGDVNLPTHTYQIWLSIINVIEIVTMATTSKE